ncbi:MAG: 3-dehydroquinate synthase [Chitinophagaceae bacterium]
MNYLQQSFQVNFEYQVFFTRDIFNLGNPCFKDYLQTGIPEPKIPKKVMFVVDEGVVSVLPGLLEKIKQYFHPISEVLYLGEMLIIPGGETAKNQTIFLERIITAIDDQGIDRHSWVVGIGGGAILDLVGFAAAVTHRGVRHIRIPTTVLSQNDSGVGVKNGINFRGKKNFIGSFVPPFAVFNDSEFLSTLSDRNWRAGISEAIKVALIKDEGFFLWLERNAQKLKARDLPSMETLIYRCASLHLQHIAGKDPFEFGSSRPLDFGHWSAHKLEQMSNFEILHGEAVAIGIALDSVYSHLHGWLSDKDLKRILGVLKVLDFTLYPPLLNNSGKYLEILQGLQEFREHLGGQLTIMLLRKIGCGVEVHELNREQIQLALNLLKDQETSPIS